MVSFNLPTMLAALHFSMVGYQDSQLCYVNGLLTICHSFMSASSSIRIIAYNPLTYEMGGGGRCTLDAPSPSLGFCPLHKIS